MATSKNTISQRQSRARRKDYITSLEQRIQQYEKQGIQATREIQLAAQKVVDENRKLKAILADLGVDDGDLEERLAGSTWKNASSSARVAEGQRQHLLKRKQTATGRCPHCGGEFHVAEQDRVTKSPTEVSNQYLRTPPYNRPPLAPDCDVPSTSPLITELSEHPQQQVRSTPRPLPTASTPSPSDPSPQPLSSPTHTSQRPPPPQNLQQPQQPSRPNTYAPSSPTTMSCSSAASIIASMRNTGTHPIEVLLELGCKNEVEGENCNVTNLKVMEVMERR